MRQVFVSGRAVCPILGTRFDLHTVPSTKGPVQPYPGPGEEGGGRGARGIGTEKAEKDRGTGRG